MVCVIVCVIVLELTYSTLDSIINMYVCILGAGRVMEACN